MKNSFVWGPEKAYDSLHKAELEQQLRTLQPDNCKHLLNRKVVTDKKVLATAVIDELQAQLV